MSTKTEVPVKRLSDARTHRDLAGGAPLPDTDHTSADTLLKQDLADRFKAKKPSLWRCLALFILLLLIVSSSNMKLRLTLLFLGGGLSVDVFQFFMTKVYTLRNGVYFAIVKFDGLWWKWAAVTKKYGQFDEEKVLAKTGQEIERILEQLGKQRAELMNWKARRWEKLRKLHWGPCAVVMYYNQYKTLESSIEKFEMDAVLQNFMMDAERSAYKCGAQLPTNDPMPV